jgi:signal peptidase I
MAKVIEKPAEKNAAAKAKPEKKKETPPEFIASMAAVLVVGLFIITFCMQAFEIPSSSMENTLLIGDHVFVDRDTMGPKTNWMPLIPYHQIRRHDIVVFLSPSEPGLYVVKRIVGIPGDRIHLQDGVLYVNGVRQDEPYVLHNGSYNPYRDNFPNVPAVDDPNITPEWHLTMRNYIQGNDVVVPPNSYFGMGDNRDVSLDSRYWGFIPRQNVIGRPMFIYWSFEEPSGEYLRTSISDRLGYSLHIIVHFFDQTRWRRMMHMVR